MYYPGKTLTCLQSHILLQALARAVYANTPLLLLDDVLRFVIPVFVVVFTY